MVVHEKEVLDVTMLISGPKQPGYDINIYLAPLIEDLKLLWEDGVQCYDAYKEESFILKAVLLWTINDFSAYGNLCGCTVKGYKACPICGDNTSSIRLVHGKKNVYMGHRRFLPRYHPYRKQKKAFNSKEERGLAPRPLSGEVVFNKMSNMNFLLGKKGINKLSDQHVDKYWKRRSAFFELLYWKKLHVRHCLDVMHIEKKICMNLVRTLLDILGKGKDGINARLDLVQLNIRTELAPVTIGKRTYIPPACYTLSKDEKYHFCKTLYEGKVPKGYSSNIQSLVSLEDLKLIGLKSHDCHVLMQQLLPIALRSVLPKHVRYAITRLCLFFNSICSKTVNVSKLDKLQEDVVVTLCLLEKYFPPSFFDVMVHLTVHLVREVKLCGPIYLRWMYPFERYMKVLKGYVHNRNRPEGSIAQSYIMEEAVEFYSEFLPGVEAVGLGSLNGKDDALFDRPLSAALCIKPSVQHLKEAHIYVLKNTEEVEPYRRQHMKYLKDRNPSRSNNLKWLQVEHTRCFGNWIRDQVMSEILDGKNITETLRWLSHGPNPDVVTYDRYRINGCTYSTKHRDDIRSVQNSGVTLVATTMQVSSAKDRNPVIGDMSFYEVIQEIWELNYNIFKLALFKCDWVENHNGVRIDDLGFTLVDLNRIGHQSDSFILATQAGQVFYVKDPSDAQWSIVVTPPQKDFSHTHCGDDIDDYSINFPSVSRQTPSFEVDETGPLYTRDDFEGTWVET